MSPTRPAHEETLARRAAAGSVEAFDELVGLHHAAVFGFLLALTRHRQDAEDLTQDTFVRAWRKFRHYDPALPLLPWLFTLGRRLSIRALRRRRPLPVEAPEPPPPAAPESARRVWEAAREHLTPAAYGALWLHYREELPLREIATIMGKREGAIKVMLHRARKLLAEKLRATAPARFQPSAIPENLTP